MGIGDQVMAAGRAKLLHRESGKKIAIARPPATLLTCDLYNFNPYLISLQHISVRPDVHWLFDYPGARPYINYEATRAHPENKGTGKKVRRWIFNMDHRPEPMEVVFSPEEEFYIKDVIGTSGRYALVEPHIKSNAPPQKQWPFDYYQDLVNVLKDHIHVIQPIHRQGPSQVLEGVTAAPMTLRQLACWMSGAVIVITGEGLQHHLAAAFDTPAVVIAGAFVPKKVTGYEYQSWIERPNANALGVRVPFGLGADIMNSIEPSEVISAVKRIVRESSRCLK